MDKTGTLPPLVHGKTRGVLDFFVDEVRIFRNILLFTGNCDVVAQVQWWGEILPTCIRPRQLYLPKLFKKCELLNSYCDVASYEIKTRLDLFKSYLETCEVLELEVYEKSDTCLIGSAFLKDLVHVVFENKKPVEIPLINYLGEKVGKIKIHINFSAKSVQINNENQNIESTEGQVFFHRTNESRKNSKIIQLKQENLLFSDEKIIYANRKSKKFNSLNKSFEIHELTPKTYQKLQINSFNKCSDMECNIAHGPRSFSSQSLLSESLKQGEMGFKETSRYENWKKAYNENVSSKCFPKVKTSDDTSKVLYFKRGFQNNESATTKTFLIPEKFIGKGAKIPFKNIGQLSSCETNKSDKDNSSIHNNNSVKSQSIKQKKNSGELPNFCNEIFLLPRLEGNVNNKILSNEFTTNKKTIDHLFGIQLSKENEESALNNLNKMSPCHDFVSSVSELCTISDNSLEKFNSGECSHVQILPPTTDYVKVNNLNFDLNNIIERKYFKTFFNKFDGAQNDFEIAEFLNKYKNYLQLEKGKSNVKINLFKDLVQSVEVKKCEDNSLNSKEIQNRDGSSVKTDRDFFLGDVNADTMTNFCAPCKYDKKLIELDDIIESLKHFEKKTLLEEKFAYQELNSAAMKNINYF